MIGMLKTFKKRGLVIARAGHSGGNYFIAERQAAIFIAIPELSVHVITAGIAGKMLFGKVQTQGRRLAGRSV
jgi:hypothetical protein